MCMVPGEGLLRCVVLRVLVAIIEHRCTVFVFVVVRQKHALTSNSATAGSQGCLGCWDHLDPWLVLDSMFWVFCWTSLWLLSSQSLLPCWPLLLLAACASKAAVSFASSVTKLSLTSVSSSSGQHSSNSSSSNSLATSSSSPPAIRPNLPPRHFLR